MRITLSVREIPTSNFAYRSFKFWGAMLPAFWTYGEGGHYTHSTFNFKLITNSLLLTGKIKGQLLNISTTLFQGYYSSQVQLMPAPNFEGYPNPPSSVSYIDKK